MDLDSFDEIPYSPLRTSIGRWEDDVLVVETSRFLPNPMGNTQGLPASSQKTFIERFQLGPDGERLSYSIELEGPVYLMEPVAFSDEWVLYGDVDPADIIVECSAENAMRAFE